MKNFYILTLALCLIYGSGFSQSTNLYPPLNLQAFLQGNEVQLSWEAPIDTSSSTAQAPEGLIGYRIYGNNNIIGSTEDSILTFIDTNPDAVVNYYKVTALYDMAFYGFPGDTAESAPSNLAFTVNETLVHLLPFTENFTTGVFSTNQWTGEPNWRIAGQSGNPAPSAEFTYAPLVSNYSLSLTSRWLYIPPFIGGDLFIAFDLKQLVNNTGTEKLILEVFDGSEWHSTFTKTNTESETWKDYKIQITNLANGKPFKFRFRAEGENSINITYWQIDNVEVYRECASPISTWVTLPNPNQCKTLVSWEIENSQPDEWIKWDNGINGNSIGLTEGGTFSAAVRFTPAQLAKYSGTSLTKVRFFPVNSPGATFVIKVWTGVNAGTLVVNQPITSVTFDQWNEITLDNPVFVTGATELWFGYTVTHTANQWPAGTDLGPAARGFGDLISTDGISWDPISTFDLNFNWNLAGLFESFPATPSIIPISYNVYREGIFIANTTAREYIDDLSNYNTNFSVCYNVTSVYEDCESEFGPMGCYMPRCFPSATDNKLPIVIDIYPNPTTGLITASYSSDITRITVLDITGRVLKVFKIDYGSESSVIDLRAHPAGIYNVKFENSEGDVQWRKIVVSR